MSQGVLVILNSQRVNDGLRIWGNISIQYSRGFRWWFENRFLNGIVYLRKKNLNLLIGFLTGRCTLGLHTQTCDFRWCTQQILWWWRGGNSKTPAIELLWDFTVTRARSFDRHQISLEDLPRPDPFQILNFLKRLVLEDWDWVSWGREKEHNRSSGGSAYSTPPKRTTLCQLWGTLDIENGLYIFFSSWQKRLSLVLIEEEGVCL